ncbi:MAG: glycosyltransferase N-terminal domain-containing protein [Pirellulales bacterium]|nr:glycosyltransferase N-terminal domain-containing protein [Pirellulales bacterium]
MSPWIFNLLYLMGGLAAAPYLLWQSWIRGKRRAGWSAKLWGEVAPWQPPPPDSPAISDTGDVARIPRIWLHAVSVGEVNLLLPLFEHALAWPVPPRFYLTTGTVAGYELARRKYPFATVSYAPLDFSWGVNQALDRIQPDLLVLVELELWPNLLALTARRGIPLALINGRLGEKSWRGYRWFRPMLRPRLAKIGYLGAQTAEYGRRFADLGVPEAAIQVTGSLKFDGASAPPESAMIDQLAVWAGITPDDTVFLAGSTGEPEEALVLGVCRHLWPDFPRLKLVLVPRHPERFDTVARLLDDSGYPWLRRSQLDQHPDPSAATPPRVILVDTIGELSQWWSLARIGFVGGSFNRRGGQNMIEPAALGVATCFGPHTWNFRDVVDLLVGQAAAVRVSDERELADFVRRCLADPGYASRLGAAARQIARGQQGATARTWRGLLPLLSPRFAAWLAKCGPILEK